MKAAAKSLLPVLAALAVIGVLGLFLPSLLGDYVTYVLMLCGVSAIAAVSLNIVLGWTGQFSIGHAGFMAVGGYTAALITKHYAHGSSFPLVFLGATIAGGVLAGIAGWLVGVPCLRLRGDYLAIVTLGFGEIIRSIIENTNRVGGATGLGGIQQPAGLFSWTYGWLAITVFFAYRLLHSTHGRAMLAVREDEIAAEAMGVNTARYKVRAFVISSFFAGVAGALFAHMLQLLAPTEFTFMKSIEIVTMVVLGGMGSTTGSVAAAFGMIVLLELLKDVQGWLQGLASDNGWSSWLTQLVGLHYETVIFSAILVAMMLLRPKGLLGHWEIWRLWERDVQPGSATQPAASRTSVPLNPSTLLLDVRQATIRFGGLTALKDFTLELRAGELVALIGPNGAGKTTAFNILTGVYAPTEGTIRVAGKSTRGLSPHRIVELGAARTFQNIRLFKELTVFDNVRVACHHLSRESMTAAIGRGAGSMREEAWISARSDELLSVMGLAHRRDEMSTSLPYGEQRRLEIARALATGPKVLLLDEPAAGMNAREKVELMELIRSIRDRFGVAILLIEHDMKLVMGVSERIIVLDHGETIARGTPQEIQRNPRVIEAYLGAESAPEPEPLAPARAAES